MSIISILEPMLENWSILLSDQNLKWLLTKKASSTWPWCLRSHQGRPDYPTIRQPPDLSGPWNILPGCRTWRWWCGSTWSRRCARSEFFSTRPRLSFSFTASCSSENLSFSSSLFSTLSTGELYPSFPIKLQVALISTKVNFK